MRDADPRTILHRGLLAGLPDAPTSFARTEAPCDWCGTATRGRRGTDAVCCYGVGCGVERASDLVCVVPDFIDPASVVWVRPGLHFAGRGQGPEWNARANRRPVVVRRTVPTEPEPGIEAPPPRAPRTGWRGMLARVRAG